MSTTVTTHQDERTRVGTGASVRVNLLPQATREGAKAARQRLLAGTAMGVLLLGLGGATYLQRAQLTEAQDELAAAQVDRAAAQSEVTELQEWAALAARLDETNATIAAALGDQSTLAGVLQDLALVMPGDGAVTSLTVSLESEVDGNGGVLATGTLSTQAETTSSHAPGVERFLLQLDRAAGFRQVYPSNSNIDEDDITTFNVTAQLGTEYLTERYVDGIPEVSR